MNAHPPQLTLASKVTIVRILGIPVFILLMIYYLESLRDGDAVPAFRWLAFGLFSLIAVTDALDGYLARVRNEITPLGRILDPLADKALMLAGLILFTRPSTPELQPQFPIWFTVLVISRDVVLVAGAGLIHVSMGRVHVQPRKTGKLATLLVMAGVAWALAGGAAGYFHVLVDVAAALTAISGAQYLFDGFRQFESEHHGEEGGHGP